VSVEFDPVRLGPRRRRGDPVVIGAIVVIVGLALAVMKPWEGGGLAGGPGPTAAAAAVSSPVAGASASPSPSSAPRTRPSVRRPAPPAPTWADIGPAVGAHDSFGALAILLGRRLTVGGAATPAYIERWSSPTLDPAGTETAFVGGEDQPVVALGVTVPPGESPQDLRIWRIHRDDQLEWIDAHAVAGEPKSRTLLFVRPGGPDSSYTPWLAGQYRVDLLVDGTIRQIAVQVTGRFGNVPPPDDPPIAASGLVAPLDSDPSRVPFGPFLTVDGTGVPLAVTPRANLAEATAWLEGMGHDVGATRPTVARIYAPRATGIGAMLTSHATVRSATVRRLSPDARLEVHPMLGGISNIHGWTPWVALAAPGDGAWPPGVYALTVAWTDAVGPHENTWHVELLPGPEVVGVAS
jgi:hypothetical protein